jgi:hypothetical protein
VAGAKHFDDITSWDPYGGGAGMFGATGWTVPGGTNYIEDADKYWGWILGKARDQYGDPGIRFNTNDTFQQRFLVFGDGARVPADRTLVYHDSASRKNWIQNDDGTVTPADENFKPVAAPYVPAGYRHVDGKFAALDAHGDQVSAPVASLPTDRVWHADRNGVLTPTNTRGDYYEIEPATGLHKYFDKNGHPIIREQYFAAPGINAPAGAPPGTAPLPTDEQQSGRTAEAVKKLQEELKARYSDLSDAEQRLAESLLTAQATTADGQRKLNDIQKKIIDAVNNPDLSLDTPAGEAAFLKFLRGQVAAIGEVVASGTLTADDQAKAIAALSKLYSLQPMDESESTAAPLRPSDAALAASPPNAAPAPAADPELGDLGLDAAPAEPDPLSSLASMLPAAAGSFPPAGPGGSPLDALGLAGPLAGLASQLADQPRRDDPAKHDDTSDTKTTGDTTEPPNKQPKLQASQPPPPEVNGTPESRTPPAASTAVQLPDGSTVNARTPAIAAAVRACLAGAPLDAAYRQAGIELPPPGTPVTNPVDPAALTAGSIGMFKDHYVVALSSAKALQDGQVVSLSSAAAGPDFLGWVDPSALGAPAATPPVAPPLMPVTTG